MSMILWKKSPLFIAMKRVACDKRLSVVFLIFGTVGLVVGCYISLNLAANVAVRLSIFGLSIGLFFLAMVSPFYAGRQQGVQISSHSNAVPEPGTDALPSPGSELAHPAVQAAVAAVTPIGTTSLATLHAEPRVVTPLLHESEHLDSVPLQSPPDLATLMLAPLSDLLLAAVCKDPTAANNLFRQALGQKPDQLTSKSVDKRQDGTDKIAV